MTRSEQPSLVVVSARSPAVLYGTAVFAILAFAVPLATIPDLDLSHGTIVVAGLLMMYGAAKLGRLVSLGEARLLEAAVWTFYYSFLTLPLLAQLSAKTFVLQHLYEYSRSVSVEVEILIAIGVVGYEAGRSVMSRRAPRALSPDASEATGSGEVHIGISTTRAALLGYLGLAFIAYTVYQRGISTFFTSRDALTQTFLGPAQQGVKFYLIDNKAGGATRQALNQVPVFVGAYLLLYTRHAARLNPRIRRPSMLLITPLLVGNLIANNPIANARFWYVTVLVAFATIYLPLRDRKAAARVFIVLFVLVSLFSFHQLAAFRRTGTVDLSNQPLSQSLVSDPDYASPQQMLNGVEYTRTDGLRWGNQLLGTVLVAVPRAVWPGKPGDTGQLVGGAAGFKVSSPLWTEGAVDFGPVGTFGYLFVIGLLTLGMDRRYMRSHAPDVIAAFTPVMASLLVFVLRGSLQPAFGSVLPVFVGVAVCIRSDRFRRRRSVENSVALQHAPPASSVPPAAAHVPSPRATSAEREVMGS